MDRTRIALRQMAREDPELAARLVLQTLPAAAARIRPPLRYELTVGELGTWLVSVDDAGARVERGTDGEVDFKLSTDEAGLAQMAAGASPLRLMLGGRVRIRGKRRRALRLRAMGAADDLSMADALDNGAELDPDAVYRSLPYLIDPEWTRG
ncbi:MAG: sterol transfer family, partial [Thermoleophilaceae bacterium]|nr:sterol transfer family [Thermoleophilaceae bacterium]